MSNEPKFFYANAMEMAASPYDISLKFMRNGAEVAKPVVPGTTVEATAVLLDSLAVSMSPSHFKAMLPGLVKIVVEYEKQFGLIPLPPDAAAVWNASFPVENKKP